MSALPLGCTSCGVLRRRHDATDHRWQAPDMPTVLARAAALKNQNECDTCDQPETAWDPFDPLYICGGVQCPDCTRQDLNDEATRNHAEVAA